MAGGLLGWAYSVRQDPIYRASATILVQYRGGGLTPGLSNFTQSEELSTTYRRKSMARPFLDRVQLDGAGISATTGTNPPVLILTATHSDPVTAASAAQQTAEKFIDYAIETSLADIARVQSAAAAQGITDIQGMIGAQFTAVDSLSLLEPVRPPGKPVIPQTRRNIQIGVVLGLIAAVAISAIWQNLRDTVRLPDQLERRFGVTGLGTMFAWSAQEVGDSGMVVANSPTSSFAEAFRQIRANIEFATTSQPVGVLLVSSPGPSEGKSAILSNLAAAFAQSGRRVLAVDADLRRPTLHRVFEIGGRDPGLSNLLARQGVELDDVIRQTGVEGVSLIPSGPSPPNPAELLGSAYMSELLQELKSRYDLVLVDSPPMLPVADGSIMASKVDGLVVVVDGFSTRSSSLQVTLDTVRNTQVNLLGVIINKLKRPRFGYGYGYGYHYYYRSYHRYYSDEDEGSVDEGSVNGANRGLRGLTKRASRIFPLFRGRQT